MPENNGCPSPQADDRDGDGVLNAVDACPDDVGPAWTRGCPDRDSHGVRDAGDACPELWGVIEHGGCPPPDDRDADGVPDAEDACADERGLPDADGCPDCDGDNIRDAEDACPDDWGLPELDGCPDRDMDGVPDNADACADQAGVPERNGCPNPQTDDRDRDGVPDDVDPAPDEPGAVEDGGAPAPGEGEDADEGGVDDAEELPEDPLDDVIDPGDMIDPGLVSVELQALEFAVDGEYDQVHCYAGVQGEDMEQFGPFEPMGERRWNIADVLGPASSRVLTIPRDQPLALQTEGGGSRSNQTYRIADIFSTINAIQDTFRAHGMECDCYAPATNSVVVGMEYGDYLQIDGRIWGPTGPTIFSTSNSYDIQEGEEAAMNTRCDT